MREIISLHDTEPGTFSNCFETHFEKALEFVYLQKKFRRDDVGDDKLVAFAKHIILEFYVFHGDVSRIDSDLDLLISKVR